MDVRDLRRKLLDSAGAQADLAGSEDPDDAQGHAMAARELTDALATASLLADDVA